MLKHKIFIAITMLIFTTLYGGYHFMKLYYNETAIVSFVYPGYERGQYPDGTRFNMFDFISDEVLQNTIDRLNAQGENIDMTINDARGSIALGVHLTAPVQERIRQARRKGQQYAYFANEYTISYSPKNRNIFNNIAKIKDSKSVNYISVLFPKNHSKQFIGGLLQSYKDFFMNSYTEVGVISKIAEKVNYQDYDYIEIANALNIETGMCIDYLYNKKMQDTTFRSETTGMTFDDLIVGFQSLQSNYISNLRAFVSASKLSKNKTELINKYRSQIERLQLLYNKSNSEAEISLNAMKHYDHTFSENIVIPAIDEENILYQARPKTAYDIITQRSLDTGVSAQNYLKDIDELNRLISEYEAVDINQAEYLILSETADELVNKIENENNRLVSLANKTIDEFIVSNSRGYIHSKIINRSYINKVTIIKLFMAALFALIFALLILIFKELISKEIDKRNGEMNEKISDMFEKVETMRKGEDSGV
jgi:hypothetical protein